ncbi:Phosphoribosylglycinamide formyltransferase [Poriferisphaera corsica]|uniref:phosphoribosylglycinamide formyltransferase 1 n=1 Tax=Poriferisphaera corsica TaxID=2528020 RepID=A0A517YTN8_9BACT|nr:phosphoribosylglycinamide formyltransferase [Poriferisphaera corsica]QDU33569.1 Phosphoribosylglycinamide formyltransferase [Poriferisphaera corsica]
MPDAQSSVSPIVPAVKNNPIRLAVLISGGGTTLTNLLDKIDEGKLKAQIATVICSNSKAYEKISAKLAGRGEALGKKEMTSRYGTFEVQKVLRKDFETTSQFSDVIFNFVRETGSDLVCLAGFLSLLDIPDDYANQVINIHPALLPSFGGKGMHGMHVHSAVVDHGVKISGCTVHFADQTYDTGPIVLQKTCPVLTGDTPDDVQARVFEQECEAFPEAIQMIADGRVTITGRTTQIQ